MILPFLREGIGEPRESARSHADRQILTLDMAGANAVGIRMAHDWDHLHGGDFRRAVPCFAFARGAVDLYQLCEVSPIFKRVRDRLPNRLRSRRL